ncbi:MAG: DUF2029 domain-containing protein [Anaerolineales bacterium]|nr:DUF2029 domain-containing protein [Anaerolineales bacterium]
MSFALIGIGLLLIAIFVWADSLGLGGDSGIGASQLLGIQVGVVAALVGIGLLTTNRDKNISVGRQFSPAKIWDLPILYWVLFTFLIAYVSFFLLPVFFSKLQIQYLTKYIPDAFVTHIGFDIEAIVSRIENWLRTGQSPYSDGFIAYPPLTIAVFATFSIIGYPAYFKVIVSITVLAYLVAALIIPLLLVPKRNQTLLLLFFITGLFSYGLQFEQERGQFNLIAFAFCLIAIYIFHFQPRFRFFAYLLFSLSIQLKVYPVFFVVMFVDDWRDWQSIVKRFLGLGLFNFSLLFVLGHKLFLDFMHSITEYQLLQSSRYENLSIKGFVYYLSNEVFGMAGTSSPAFTRVAETFFWLLLGTCFLILIGYAIFRKTRGLNLYLLLICTIAALIIPSVSNDYKLSILIAPMTLAFCCLPEIVDPKKKVFSILLLVLASFSYWTTLYPATVKPEYLGRNFPALIIILISITVLHFLVPYTIGNSPISNNPHEVDK